MKARSNRKFIILPSAIRVLDLAYSYIDRQVIRHSTKFLLSVLFSGYSRHRLSGEDAMSYHDTNTTIPKAQAFLVWVVIPHPNLGWCSNRVNFSCFLGHSTTRQLGRDPEHRVIKGSLYWSLVDQVINTLLETLEVSSKCCVSVNLSDQPVVIASRLPVNTYVLNVPFVPASACACALRTCVRARTYAHTLRVWIIHCVYGSYTACIDHLGVQVLKVVDVSVLLDQPPSWMRYA